MCRLLVASIIKIWENTVDGLLKSCHHSEWCFRGNLNRLLKSNEFRYVARWPTQLRQISESDSLSERFISVSQNKDFTNWAINLVKLSRSTRYVVAFVRFRSYSHLSTCEGLTNNYYQRVTKLQAIFWPWKFLWKYDYENIFCTTYNDNH